MRHALILLLFISFQLRGQQVLPERQRAEVVDNILKDRFNNLLPKLMDDTGFDMWVVIARE